MTYDEIAIKIRGISGIYGPVRGAPQWRRKSFESIFAYFMAYAVTGGGRNPEYDMAFRRAGLEPRLPSDTGHPPLVLSDRYRILNNRVEDSERGYPISISAVQEYDGWVLVMYSGRPVAVTVHEAFRRGLTEIKWPEGDDEDSGGW